MAKILIIDDESFIAAILKEILDEEGHEVSTAEDGIAALKLLEQSSKPDLMLVDLFMPGMGGREFIEIINADPKLKGVPVILTTGSIPSVKDIPPGECYQDIIYKPFDIEEVVMKVEKLLEKTIIVC